MKTFDTQDTPVVFGYAVQPDLRIRPTLAPHDTEVNLGSIANGRIESRLALEAGSALQVRGASSRQETLRLQHQIAFLSLIQGRRQCSWAVAH